MSAAILPCPKCDGIIAIYPSSGGRGTGEATAYQAECKCGLEVPELGVGSMRSAVLDWNKYVRQQSRQPQEQHK